MFFLHSGFKFIDLISIDCSKVQFKIGAPETISGAGKIT
jgi:hypothetical protein